jgi:hypothetical protein
MLVAETSNRLEPTSVRAGAAMAKVSRCNDWAKGWAAEGSWLLSRQGKGIFIYSKTSGPALGPTQPSVQWAPVDLTTGKAFDMRGLLLQRVLYIVDE